MKKILMIFLCISFFACKKSNAQVQRNTDPSQNVATTSDKKKEKLAMMKSLNLSKEQRAELKDFHRSQKQKKGSIMNDQSLTDAQKKQQLQELHKEQKEKLNSVLTPEQKEKLKDERMNNKDERLNNKMQKRSMSDSTGATK